jgi:hypothetical protein
MRKILRYATVLLIVLAISLATFVPAQAAVTISVTPTIGSVGTSVTVSGNASTHGETITVSYNDGTNDVTKATPTSDATTGNWTATFTIPSSVAGAHDITASGTGSGTASTSFTVRPKITVSQPAGGITINGTGFGDSENITINIDTTQGVATATADVNGSFSVSGLVVDAGSHTFEAINDAATHDATATFTVVSHTTIALGKTSGPVGTSVTINGAGFPANEPGITVTFDGTQVGATTTASSSGAWTLTFTIPSVAGGQHIIDASGSVTSATSITDQSFNVTPVINLKPTSASPGATVTVTGSGFAASENNINVTYDGEAIGTPAAASATGTWTTTFKVPPGSAGSHTIDASGSNTSSASVPDLSFKVGAGITVNKSSGGAGTSITVAGAGFGSGEAVTVIYDTDQVGSATANPDGSWTLTFNVPPSPAGSHTINASGSTTSVVTVPFTSTASVNLPPNTTSGTVGSSINLTGSGFAANETISITFDGKDIGTTSADDQGGVADTITIPPSTAGTHNITVKGSTTSNLSFKITPSLSLNPSSGYVSTPVNIAGSGFAAASVLQFTYDGNPISNVGTVKTDDTGSFTKQISIPVSEAGTHTVKVQDAQKNNSSTDYTVNSVALSVPNPISPSDGSKVGLTGGAAPDLKWSPVSGPNGGITYDLQIDNDPDFPHPMLVKTGLSVPHYTLNKTEALPSGTYYWRVRAVDAASNQSDWSQPLQFQSGAISAALLVILIVVVVIIVIVLLMYFLVLPMQRKRKAAQAATAAAAAAAAAYSQAPEIVIPEVVNAEYRAIDPEDAGRKTKALPWRLALPQAPVQPKTTKGGRTLSPEDQARLKVIIDFAKSLPLIEPGNNASWIVDLAESVSGDTASPALYGRLLKGELQVRYEPAWMRHPTFMDLQTLLEGQPILQDLDSFVDSVNHSASESLLLLQDIYRDASAEVTWDILANNGWGYISGVYTDALSWFLGKYLREPSERDYTVKPDAKSGEGPGSFVLSGESSTPFAGPLVLSPDENEAITLRALHLKLRRNYRNNDKSKEVVGYITQLGVQRERLLNAFNQFNRLNP